MPTLAVDKTFIHLSKCINNVYDSLIHYNKRLEHNGRAIDRCSKSLIYARELFNKIESNFNEYKSKHQSQQIQ